jgi:hypothetical protein
MTDKEETPGIGTYTTRDSVRVVQVHYSADPMKVLDTVEGQKWVRATLAKGYVGGMAGDDWQQEMEMNPNGTSSPRIFPDFVDKMQPAITFDQMDIPDHWPIYAGYDYGTASPFSWVAVAWESESKFYQFDEIYKKGMSVYEQVQLIKARPYFPQIQGIIGDPSIWNRTQNSERNGQPVMRSVGEMFRDDYGIEIERGRNEPGVDIAFKEYLKSQLWRNLDDPMFMIAAQCRATLREFRLLRREVWATKGLDDRRNAQETIVQKDNHAWDALKYLLLWKQGETPDSLPPPVASFDWLRERMSEMRKRAEMRLA